MDLKSFREDKLKIKSQSAFADFRSSVGNRCSDVSSTLSNLEAILLSCVACSYTNGLTCCDDLR